MTEATQAMDDAAYAALIGFAWASPVPMIQQHPLKDSGYPLILVGDIDAITQIGPAGDRDRQANVTIIIMTDDMARGPCNLLVDQSTLALNGKTIIVPGWRIAFSILSGSSTLAEDGKGYVGVAMFQALAIAD
jgi:hypothetical protein